MTPTPEEMNAAAFNARTGGNQQQSIARINAQFASMDKSSKSISKSFTADEKMAQGMNKSFQGMQAKGQAIQKIISTAFDFMGIGTSKMKKDIVGALKKGIAEGDIAGMIQGLLDGFTRYIDMSGMDKPWEMAFRPFSIMIGAIGAQAAGIIASSDAFKTMIDWLASDEGQQAITNFATQISNAMKQFGMMDIELMMEFITFIVDEITKLGAFVKRMRNFGSAAGTVENIMGASPDELLQLPGAVADRLSQLTSSSTSSTTNTNTINVNVEGVVSDLQLNRTISSIQKFAARWSV
jgi:hypothetical protein